MAIRLGLPGNIQKPRRSPDSVSGHILGGWWVGGGLRRGRQNVRESAKTRRSWEAWAQYQAGRIDGQPREFPRNPGGRLIRFPAEFPAPSRDYAK